MALFFIDGETEASSRLLAGFALAYSLRCNLILLLRIFLDLLRKASTIEMFIYQLISYDIKMCKLWIENITK